MTDALEVLRAFIRDEVGYEGEIDPNVDLLEAKILDSFSVVQVAAFMQTYFDLELQAEDVVRENFASLAAMVALIEKRKA